MLTAAPSVMFGLHIGIFYPQDLYRNITYWRDGVSNILPGSEGQGGRIWSSTGAAPHPNAGQLANIVLGGLYLRPFSPGTTEEIYLCQLWRNSQCSFLMRKMKAQQFHHVSLMKALTSVTKILYWAPRGSNVLLRHEAANIRILEFIVPLYTA